MGHRAQRGNLGGLLRDEAQSGDPGIDGRDLYALAAVVVEKVGRPSPLVSAIGREERVAPWGAAAVEPVWAIIRGYERR